MASTTYPGLQAASSAVQTRASPNTFANGTSASVSTRRRADDTTSNEMAMVIASCDPEADAWNIATGRRPMAQKAHCDRVARRRANHTIPT